MNPNNFLEGNQPHKEPTSDTLIPEFMFPDEAGTAYVATCDAELIVPKQRILNPGETYVGYINPDTIPSRLKDCNPLLHLKSGLAQAGLDLVHPHIVFGKELPRITIRNSSNRRMILDKNKGFRIGNPYFIQGNPLQGDELLDLVDEVKMMSSIFDDSVRVNSSTSPTQVLLRIQRGLAENHTFKRLAGWQNGLQLSTVRNGTNRPALHQQLGLSPKSINYTPSLINPNTIVLSTTPEIALPKNVLMLITHASRSRFNHQTGLRTQQIITHSQSRLLKPLSIEAEDIAHFRHPIIVETYPIPPRIDNNFTPSYFPQKLHVQVFKFSPIK